MTSLDSTTGSAIGTADNDNNPPLTHGDRDCPSKNDDNDNYVSQSRASSSLMPVDAHGTSPQRESTMFIPAAPDVGPIVLRMDSEDRVTYWITWRGR